MKLLRKYVLWLIAATLAGIVGAVLVHAILPAHYVSSAEVDVEPNIPALTIDYAPNMVTEQEVATSGVVLADAATALRTTTTALTKDLSATVSGTNATGGAANVLSINCSMKTAVAAQRCASVAAAAYTAFRNDTGQPLTTQAHDPMHVTLVTAATLPTSRAGSGLKILLPIGAFLGLALGIGAIFVRDHFDHRVRGREDLERVLEAPVLAAIPLARHSRDVFSRRPLSPAAEAFRYFREHLTPLVTSVPDGGAVLLAVGAETDDGRTSVAANLAAALAEPGAKVLLVDADVWHPSLGAVFEAGSRPGLSDLIAGRSSLDEVAVQVPHVPGLRLVTTGLGTAKPAEIFREGRLAQAFQDMRTQADVVVVVGAPVLESSQTIALARVSDIVALVTDARHTTREAVAAAAQEIRATGPRVVVGVLTGLATPVNPQARAAVPPRAESMSTAAEAPAILADTVPPRGANGHRPKQFGAAHVYPPQHGEGESEAGGEPGSEG